MGVYRFFNNFVKNVSPESIVKSPPEKIRGVCFDLNGTIHPIAQEVFMYGAHYPKEKEDIDKYNKKLRTLSYKSLEKEFLNNLTENIKKIIDILSPYEFIIIAVDGIPPLAKISQQRKRRLKSYLDEINTKKNPYYPPLGNFNGSFISPGTPFMENVHNTLISFVMTYSKTFKANSLIYTSFKEPGEGEHKFFDRLRTPLNLSKGTFFDPTNEDPIILWGSDSDLSILSLASNIKNIYIARESLSEIINITSLRNDINENYLKKDQNIESRDFCFLTNFVGNDFLPKNNIYETNFQEEVFNAYYKVKNIFEKNDNCCLTYDNDLSVNINFLFHLLNEFRKYETDMATNVYLNQKRNKEKFFRTSSLLERSFDKRINKIDIKLYNKFVIEDIEFFQKNEYPEISKNKEMQQRYCFDYLNTMLWMYTYYTKGASYINWDFQFNGLIAPSVTFILEHINSAEEFLLLRPKNVFKDEEEVDFDSNGKPPINMGEQLLIILPPPVIEKVFEEKIKSPEFYEMSKRVFELPSNIIFYEDGKKAEYEKEPILDSINIKDIKDNKIMDVYAKMISDYEKKNKDKIKEKRIRDFDEKGIGAVNERILKNKLYLYPEYKYRKILYEEGDYVFFQRTYKPNFPIPKFLREIDDESKDSVIIKIKNFEEEKINKIDFKEISKKKEKSEFIRKLEFALKN